MRSHVDEDAEEEYEHEDVVVVVKTAASLSSSPFCGSSRRIALSSTCLVDSTLRMAALCPRV